MTREHFTARLEEELRRLRAQFSLADLAEFVVGRWLAIAQDPDPVRWASEFLDTGKATVVV